MKVLVTGGCGFIGSHLCRALEEAGHHVRVLDNLSSGDKEALSSSVELVIGDIRDAPLFQSVLEGVDFCFHLAAVASVQQSREAWQETHSINLSGMITLFEAVRRYAQRNDSVPIPVVYASSAAVYGNGAENPLSEDMAVQPFTPYGADKLGCEQHAYVARTLYGIPNIGFRFFNVYGPGQNPNSPYSGVISVFLKRCAENNPVTIYGDGEQVRDFVYVGDVVSVLMQSMGKMNDQDAGIFNICTGKATSIHKLVQTIGEISQKEIPCDYQPERRSDIRTSIGNPSRLERWLGNVPQTSLEVGLKMCIDENIKEK
ncbi:MAG: NAD-dependent epimerase/dehydratase family protein [Alphaproteobacteria bacterium]|nr:NAD-dependent epimerase/dehydratase family protein [Alphaproteobacteria bacterium]